MCTLPSRMENPTEPKEGGGSAAVAPDRSRPPPGYRLCKLWMGSILVLSAVVFAHGSMKEGLFGWFLITMAVGPFLFARSAKGGGA